MGFSAPNSGASGGRSHPSTPTTLAEINVTPLVDVMLVLLIVFMISAPLMQQGVQVELPKANAGSLTETPEQLVLVISKNKQLTINGNAIAEGGLKARLEALGKARGTIEVFIQADQGVPYGFVAQVMAEVKKAKITRIGLVTDPADPNFHL